MRHTSRITQFASDPADPASLAAKARARRWKLLGRTFPELREMTVLDLGGLTSEWARAPVHAASVTVLNLFDQSSTDGIEAVVGDACDPPDELRSRRFDLVFSNSVLDLVGGHFRRLQFAETVHTMAPAHWIQNAYLYFPVDAYTLFPGQQLLPLCVRAAVSRRWPLGYRHAAGYRESVLRNLEFESLSKTAFRAYFPGSVILKERAAGLVKSLIAVQTDTTVPASASS